MTHADVTPTELAILEKLWEGTPLTIRELTESLYQDGGTSAYATVQKLLDRLESKGFVSRVDRVQRAHRFRAEVERAEIIDRRLRDLADQLCAGSLSPLLTHLVRGRRLRTHELDELKGLLGEIDARRGRRGGKKS